MTSAMHRLLVVEDDPAMRKVLSVLFESNGFRVDVADTSELAIRLARTQRPDVVILDLGLPDWDGFTVIEQIRTWSPLPVIVLTARTQEDQRLAAFELGADDYVTKPFSSRELLARVRAVMRRAARSDQPNATLELGRVTVELGNRVARHQGGVSAKLTPLEHRILECLLRHADGIVTHSQILKEVWGPHQSDIRALRVYVASLRRKLEYNPARPRHILTESGIGYRLATATASANDPEI
jgi:two-component system, OmpR family, KDP operon response regulator KdpE